MPNWYDDEGNCHFDVNGVPCYESPKGSICGVRSTKTMKKTNKKIDKKAIQDTQGTKTMKKTNKKIDKKAIQDTQGTKKADALLTEKLKALLKSLKDLKKELKKVKLPKKIKTPQTGK